MPSNLLNTNEPDDVITATLLFSVMNKYSINDIVINEHSDMTISFTNDTKIIIKGHVKHVDWTWAVTKENGDSIVQCDFGTLIFND